MTCIGEPVSWLALERHALGELPPERAGAVAAHLGACGACQACFAGLEARPLPPLPAAAPRRSWQWARRLGGLAKACFAGLEARPLPPLPAAAPRRSWQWALGAGGLAVAAAALLLWRSPGDDGGRALHARTGRKGGGEIVLALVRERGGSVSHDPTGFSAGDRFKVVVTCPPAAALHGDVVVFQAEQASFPLSPASIACGNRVALPGAFRLTGAEPATICLAFAEGAAPDRAALARHDPRDLLCVLLLPE